MSLGLIRTGAGQAVSAPAGGAYVDDFSNAVGDTIINGRNANNTSGPAWTWDYSLLLGSTEDPGVTEPDDLVIRPSSGYCAIDTRTSGATVERIWHLPDMGSPDHFIEIEMVNVRLEADFGIAVRVDLLASSLAFVVAGPGSSGFRHRTNEGFSLGNLAGNAGDVYRLIADGNNTVLQNLTQVTNNPNTYGTNQVGNFCGIWSRRNNGTLDDMGVKIRAGVYPDDI